MEIKRILKCYELALGQKINFSKLAVTFSLNMDQNLHISILKCLGMEASQSHGKYLGLPTLISRNKRSTFNEIKEKVWNKLQGGGVSFSLVEVRRS